MRFESLRLGVALGSGRDDYAAATSRNVLLEVTLCIFWNTLLPEVRHQSTSRFTGRQQKGSGIGYFPSGGDCGPMTSYWITRVTPQAMLPKCCALVKKCDGCPSEIKSSVQLYDEH
jgi:hypothetical protein